MADWRLPNQTESPEAKARRMRANGHPVPVICQYTGLSVRQVVIALHAADMLDDNLIMLYGKRLYEA